MEREQDTSVVSTPIVVAPAILAPQVRAFVDDLARLVAELAFEGLLPGQTTQTRAERAKVEQ